MTQSDHSERGVVFSYDDQRGDDGGLELEVIVDPEEGLAWGLWWRDGDQLLAVFTASKQP